MTKQELISKLRDDSISKLKESSDKIDEAIKHIPTDMEKFKDLMNEAIELRGFGKGIDYAIEFIKLTK